MSQAEIRRKRPGERRKATFNFFEKLDPTDSLIGSPTMFSTPGITLGVPVVSSPRVAVFVTGGVGGSDYSIVCTMNTALGSELSLEVIVEVR